MSVDFDPEWAPIELSEKLQDKTRCPICGKSYFDLFEERFEEYRTGDGYSIPHIPNEVSVYCDNEDCEYGDFEVKLRVLILPLE